jgi:hypothetical protein
MSFSSTRDTYLFSRKVGTSLQDLKVVKADEEKPERLHSLRERLLYGQSVGVTVLSPTRFKVEINVQAYSQSLHKDLYFGLCRIGRLRNAVGNLRISKCASAWQVTTSYYAAFFAATELLRTTGVFISYFDGPAAASVSSHATGTDVLEGGTFEGLAKWDDVNGVIQMEYSKRNIRHHDFTWQKCVALANGIASSAKPSQRAFVELFLKLAGGPDSNWGYPSSTRNKWNYADADLFVARGEHFATQFRKLSASDSTAINWGKEGRLTGEDSAVSAVAFVNSFLSQVLSDVSNIVFANTKIQPAKLIGLT